MHVSDNNGTRLDVVIPTKDKITIALSFTGLVLVVFGMLVSLSIYIFQPRTEAMVVHSGIREEAAAAKAEAEKARAIIEVRAAARDEKIDKLGQAITVTNENIQDLMREVGVGRRKIRSMPAGVSFGAGDE